MQLLNRTQQSCKHCATMLKWYQENGTMTLSYRCSVCGSTSEVSFSRQLQRDRAPAVKR